MKIVVAVAVSTLLLATPATGQYDGENSSAPKSHATPKTVEPVGIQANGSRGASPVGNDGGSRADGPLLISSASFDSRCATAWKAVRWYRARTAEHRATMGGGTLPPVEQNASCHRLRERARYWQTTANTNRAALERWRAYHYAWVSWLPAKWQRIGACETGYGRRPGNWRHTNSSYEGAFGFAKSSWDQFKRRADRKAGPYPDDAWQATPRQQYEVALAIYRRYGLSGWGCRGA